MKVDVELEPFTPLLRPTYADAHAGAISEVRMEGYEFGHTYVWQGPGHKNPEINMPLRLGIFGSTVLARRPAKRA